MLFLLNTLWALGDRVKTWRQKIEEEIVAMTLFAFVVMSLIPHQALAFSQVAEASIHPLVFTLPQGEVRKIVLGGEAYAKPQELELRPGMTLSVLASAYSSTAGQTDADPFTTASGMQVGPGIVAANFLPLGTRLQWGEQELQVQDRLNARYNNAFMIDVWMPSQEAAFAFGVRLITVRILELPETE